jgi:hypothetical protein
MRKEDTPPSKKENQYSVVKERGGIISPLEVYLPKTDKKITTTMRKSIYFDMISPLFTHFFTLREPSLQVICRAVRLWSVEGGGKTGFSLIYFFTY